MNENDIKPGYVYHIKDTYFRIAKDDKLMRNYEGGAYRPTYFCVKDEKTGLLWVIPMSTRTAKFTAIVQKDIFNEIKSRDFRHVQFIPCPGELEEKTPSPLTLSPRQFASFYNILIPLWLKGYTDGNYYSIKLIDDAVNLFRSGQVNACGLTGQCHPQIVVESYGSVYPCDFYVLDRFRLGSLREQSLDDIIRISGRLFTLEDGKEPTLCKNCRYLPVCHGGCKRMIDVTVSDSFCAWRSLLDRNLQALIGRVG